jgi:hypothetical protein
MTPASWCSEPPAELGPVDPPPVIDAAVSVTENNTAYLLFDLGSGQQLQLIHEGLAATAAIIPLGVDGFDRLEAVYRLLALCMAVRFLPTRLTAQQRARMRRMLQAFDGHRAGATGREIAQVIQNRRIGPHEWQTSSVRYAVKALIRDARTMIAGGYRKLLRHRRVS